MELYAKPTLWRVVRKELRGFEREVEGGEKRRGVRYKAGVRDENQEIPVYFLTRTRKRNPARSKFTERELMREKLMCHREGKDLNWL